MTENKLISLVKTFSKEDVKNFGKFISSPYFSSSRDLKPLFSLLKKYYPDFKPAALTEEKIFKRLYPRKVYVQKKFSRILQVLFSEMYKQAEKFMVYESLKGKSFNYMFNISLSEIYMNKQLYDLSLKNLVKITGEYKRSDRANYVRNLLETYMHISDVFIFKVQPEKNYDCTSNAILYMYAYIIELMAYFYNKNRVNLRNYNIRFNGSEFIFKFVSEFNIEQFNKDCNEDEYGTKTLTTIKYYYLKSFVDEKSDEHIPLAAQLLIENFDKFTYSIQYDLFSLIFNRCIGKASSNPVYFHLGNKLVDFVWGKGVVSTSQNKFIFIVTFTSILNFKLATVEAKKIQEFADKYTDKVEPEYKKISKSYSSAVILFKKKSFSQCLKEISIEEKVPFFIKNGYHILKICSLYELEYNESLVSAIDSFEHFTRKNKSVSALYKSSNLDFIQTIKKLIRLKIDNNGNHLKLTEEITELSGSSYYKWWFDEKIKEILKYK